VDGEQGSAWILIANGMVYSAGAAPLYGSTKGKPFHGSMVGMASTPNGKGYWLTATDGVFSFGDAAYYGSMGGLHLNAPVVGIASAPDGKGYWLAASMAACSRSEALLSKDQWLVRSSPGPLSASQPMRPRS
jgi:hypothetical protein